MRIELAKIDLKDHHLIIADLLELGLPSLSFGVGLHCGEVVYGKVGGAYRLDFTVMGVAVNRTARLESQTEQIGTPLLVSDVLAGLISKKTTYCREYAVKGVAEPLQGECAAKRFAADTARV